MLKVIAKSGIFVFMKNVNINVKEEICPNGSREVSTNIVKLMHYFKTNENEYFYKKLIKSVSGTSVVIKYAWVPLFLFVYLY